VNTAGTEGMTEVERKAGRKREEKRRRRSCLQLMEVVWGGRPNTELHTTPFQYFLKGKQRFVAETLI
jgi:hypothetical protein